MMLTLLHQIIYFKKFNLYNHILVKSTNQLFDISCSIDIDNRETWRLIMKVLTEHYADLSGLLKPLIADLARRNVCCWSY